MEIWIEDLNKSYGEKQALSDFTALFENGIYGILGPNGAGKSTLMNILTDNLLRDSGRILLDGEEILDMKEKYREIMGYMPQQQQLYDTFTVQQFLLYIGALRGMSRKRILGNMTRLLHLLNLEDMRYTKLKELSGGMKQRVLLLQALLHNPKVLILDEPTAGLDPRERIRLRNFIADLSRDKIILIATHVVSDIEFISKEILLMKDGRLLDMAPSEELQKKIAGKVFEVSIPSEKLKQVKQEYRVSNIYRSGENVVVRILSDEVPGEYEYREVVPGMEDVYLYQLEDRNQREE
ncbi:ATP-binding cassette domain-containing protein [Faecalicatena sp. AGMB00832]|uniref:ATP-binding cassette domain-containing protein n=1 Tax=Faecalicatena faecalis TaxID=2726362 RepID=A0ABS6D6G7_9FIRM|nr:MULTISPECIES: ATP-binding cassette domain-containing protein [Faecalicatena]MBU3877205.1 ATP-binding cassette domain-containing protein [Faecalicatena faecalis]MCI6467274.1 ATP-binding cassette domain-containing protein [Faecalicatena sp.]MDY5620279.1 ATP-binding cassette domain-containing protein [Lachnospiraceae bacterium]